MKKLRIKCWRGRFGNLIAEEVCLNGKVFNPFICKKVLKHLKIKIKPRKKYIATLYTDQPKIKKFYKITPSVIGVPFFCVRIQEKWFTVGRDAAYLLDNFSPESNPVYLTINPIKTKRHKEYEKTY